MKMRNSLIHKFKMEEIQKTEKSLQIEIMKKLENKIAVRMMTKKYKKLVGLEQIKSPLEENSSDDENGNENIEQRKASFGARSISRKKII